MYLHTIPAYVYKITVIETGEFYFGFRSKNITLNRNPQDDLLIHYVSSSKIIKDIVRTRGKSAISASIIFEDTDIETAFWYEQKLIEDHFNDPRILNKQYINRESRKKMFLAHGLVHSEESVKRASATRRRNGKSGYKQTPESIKKQLDSKEKSGFKAMSSLETIAKWKESRKLNNKKRTPEMNQKTIATKLAKWGTLSIKEIKKIKESLKNNEGRPKT